MTHFFGKKNKRKSETMNLTVKGGAIMVKGGGGVGGARPCEAFTLYNMYLFKASILYKEHCYVCKLKNQLLKKMDASLKRPTFLGPYSRLTQ